MFNYTSDFDKNGLFYWLGTFQLTEQWRNPASDAMCRPGVMCVRTSRSSEGSPRHDSTCLLRRTAAQCYTAPELNAWWQVDLGGYVFKVERYTLRDGEDYRMQALRNWELQGSLNGSDWITIKKHEDDRTLNKPNGVATWYIGTIQHQFGFRFFRILQTGPNAGGNYYLNLAGMELYGQLFGACLVHILADTRVITFDLLIAFVCLQR